MNALLRLFAKLSLRSRWRGAAACVLLAGAGTGCANPFATAEIDSTSTAAAEIGRMAAEPRRAPQFTDIPPVPKADRPLAAWGKEADQIETAAAKLERETAPGAWTLNDTARFAARAKSDAGPDLDASAPSAAATEAFAKQLRERATPPPSPR